MVQLGYKTTSKIDKVKPMSLILKECELRYDQI